VITGFPGETLLFYLPLLGKMGVGHVWKHPEFSWFDEFDDSHLC